MIRLFAFFAFLEILGSSITAQRRYPLPFSIEIQESTFMYSSEYLLTDTSIYIRQFSPLTEAKYTSRIYYDSKALLDLSDYIQETNFDSVRMGYKNTTVDDAPDFKITILVNGKKTVKDIYMVEYLEYMRLVEYINNAIPDYFAINYNYNYLHGKLLMIKK